MEDPSGARSPPIALSNKYFAPSRFPYMIVDPVADTGTTANSLVPGYAWPAPSIQRGFQAPLLHVPPPTGPALGLDPIAFHNPAFGYSAPPPLPTPGFHGPFPPGVSPGLIVPSSTGQVTNDYTADKTSNLDYPASPLRALSDVPDSTFITDSGPEGRLRRRSEPDYVGKYSTSGRVHKRKTTWSEGQTEGLNISQEQKQRELMELERLSSAGPAARQEKRRLQNRLAQRSFRARAKVLDKEAANHMADLERVAEETQEKLERTQDALHAVQKENAMLRARLEQQR